MISNEQHQFIDFHYISAVIVNNVPTSFVLFCFSNDTKRRRQNMTFESESSDDVLEASSLRPWWWDSQPWSLTQGGCEGNSGMSAGGGGEEKRTFDFPPPSFQMLRSKTHPTKPDWARNQDKGFLFFSSSIHRCTEIFSTGGETPFFSCELNIFGTKRLQRYNI